MKLVCLLPVRNGESDLPDYFASAARFADAVVALDDGSDDGTRAILEREPLVKKLLSNPVRAGYRGWNDAANRNALLQAAAELEPDWIISVDADEHIDPGDAKALREFLESDALPGLAYGFRCYSMVGGLNRALPVPIWVYRLFAFQPGQQFPNQQLHFAPIPADIPRRAFVRTTFRIQHLGGVSPERRLARYEKYRQADPDCRYWPDYAGLLKEPAPDEIIEWPERDPSWPAFFSSELDLEAIKSDQASSFLAGAPDMTVVVLNDGPGAGVRRALESAVSASTAMAVEVLLVSRSPLGFDVPAGVRVISVEERASRGAMRNAGTSAAAGRHVAFIDSDLALAPDAVGRLLDGHRRGFASVTGGVVDRSEDATRQAYFAYCFDSLRTGRPEAIIDRAPPWASYARSLLLETGGFSETLPGGEEIDFGRRLVAQGYLTLRLSDPVLVYHGETVTSRGRGMKLAFARGRAIARQMMDAYADKGELLDRDFVRKNLPSRRPARSTTSKPDAAQGSARSGFRRFHASLEVAQKAGTWAEALKPARGKGMLLFGRPGGIALVVVARRSAEPSIAIVRFDLAAGFLKVVELPPRLCVPAADGAPTRLHQLLAPIRGEGGLDRFTAHDAVGRPFQLWIDDIVWVDGSAPSMRDARARTSLHDALRRITKARALPVTMSAVWRGDRVRTTFARRAAVLAILRLRRLLAEQFSVISPFGDDEILDGDGVELVRSFLGADEIRRPPTRQAVLRQVEWA